jgi:hypothetical protein
MSLFQWLAPGMVRANRMWLLSLALLATVILALAAKSITTTLSSSAVTASATSLNTIALVLGSHTTNAEYPGDSGNNPSIFTSIDIGIRVARQTQ